MMQPFKPGDRLTDHAAPIGEVMQQLQTQLAEYKALKELLGGGAAGVTTGPGSFSEPSVQVDSGESNSSSSTSSLVQLPARPDSPHPSDVQPQ
jgi:adenylate cyclase